MNDQAIDLTSAEYRAHVFANHESMSREDLIAFLEANDPDGNSYNDRDMLLDIGEVLEDCELHDAVRTIEDPSSV